MRRCGPALLFVLAACSRAPDPAPPAPPSARAAATALGVPITSQIVALADIANNPARYASQTVATTGRVTAVCREMGCWMEIGDDSGRAHVKMHGHSFFVPKTASGHVARVQAIVVRGGDRCEDAPPKSDRGAPEVELDATGVELD